MIVTNEPKPASRMRPEILVLGALAGALNLWALSRNGFAAEYYAGAVRSMAGSWHAFLYGSFDPAGVMTVDKPPLALWIQALSARIFGFGPWSLLVPQALMGVATVLLTYDLTRLRFGRAAGFAAGLALALTPVMVAISRHNNLDALLVLCVTAALWCLVRGLQDGRTRWIVLCGVCVGLGFEAKMAAALVAVPAIAAAWLYAAPLEWRVAVRRLAAGAAAALAAGGAWPVLVALTPAADRPWVSGTDDNSIWSLILGYNGLGRAFGEDDLPDPPGPRGLLLGEEPGPLRLLNESLGAQASWLLGFALVAAVALAVVTRLDRSDPRTGWLLAVGGTALTGAVALSFAAGIFHPYYVVLLAPALAALVGAGTAQILTGGQGALVLGPLAVAGGVVTELVVAAEHPQLDWVRWVLLAGFPVAAVALTLAATPRLRACAVAGALGLLLIAPATRAVQTLDHATSGTFPAGGPLLPGTGKDRGPGSRGIPSLARARAHARSHGGGTIAVDSQVAAARAVRSGADVAAIGGYTGRESEVDAGWLAGVVASGRVRWALTTESPGAIPGDRRAGARPALAAVRRAGVPVPGVRGLYDLRGRAAALRAAGS